MRNCPQVANLRRIWRKSDFRKIFRKSASLAEPEYGGALGVGLDVEDLVSGSFDLDLVATHGRGR
ncbi:MAG: hypothetical protein IRZ15_15180 [Bryobacteraceae bacterium]|nr:hypothetical protein [Bryobacteraceae bacterium]